MPLHRTLFPILSAIPLLCGLHGCMSDARIASIHRQQQEEARFYDSLVGTRNGAFEFIRSSEGLGAGGGRGEIVYPVGAAFRTLLAQPDAPALFMRLIREGACAGQLYGLAGLHAVDSVLFARELPAFLARTDSVEYQTGCFVWKEAVAQVAMKTEEPRRAGASNYSIGSDIHSGGFLRDLMSYR